MIVRCYINEYVMQSISLIERTEFRNENSSIALAVI